MSDRLGSHTQTPCRQAPALVTINQNAQQTRWDVIAPLLKKVYSLYCSHTAAHSATVVLPRALLYPAGKLTPCCNEPVLYSPS